MSKSIKVISRIFALAIAVTEMATFQFFYLEKKLGQGHELQLSQWRHSMANIKVYKRYLLHFYFLQDTIYMCGKKSNTHRNGQAPAIAEILQISLMTSFAPACSIKIKSLYTPVCSIKMASLYSECAVQK